MYQSRILRRVRQQRLLHEVSLELTYGCNLDCFFCYNDREKTGVPLSLDQYRDLLQDLARMQTLYLMLTGGEPMIHPHFFDIGRMARELGFVVRVRTNGHSLGPATAQRLRSEVDPYLVEVSLHGASAQVHDRQTRVEGSFNRLVKNIGTARRAGLRLSVVCTPTAWNEHQIDAMYELCDSLDVPLRFQGPVAPRDNGDRAPLAIQPAQATWRHIAARHARDRAVDAPESRPSCGDREAGTDDPPATCSVGVAGVDIDPYGNVQACMHLQESAGNLHRQSIEDIWNGAPLFRRARERAIESARQFDLIPVRQLGAPVYCLAVEENLNKSG